MLKLLNETVATDSIKNTHFAIGIIIAILLIVYNVPQTIRTARLKSIQGINFYSFWSLLIGSFLWCLVFATGTPRVETALIIAFSGNTTAALLLTVNIILFYQFNSDLKLSKKRAGQLGIISVLIIFIIMASISQSGLIFANSNAATYTLVISIIAGLNTSFSFLPQIIFLIRSKITKGISLQLVFGFALINFVIMLLWVIDYQYGVTPTKLENKIAYIVLNLSGAIVNLVQFIFIFIYRLQKSEIKWIAKVLALQKK